MATTFSNAKRFLKQITGRFQEEAPIISSTRAIAPAVSADADRIPALNQQGYLDPSLVAAKELLTADRTYYVDVAAGDDTNDGLTAGTAFETIEHALSITASIDAGLFELTIQLADGDYSSDTIEIKDQRVAIVGNPSTPANVIIDYAGFARSTVVLYGATVDRVACTAHAGVNLITVHANVLTANDNSSVTVLDGGYKYITAFNGSVVTVDADIIVSSRQDLINASHNSTVILSIRGISGTGSYSNAIFNVDYNSIVSVDIVSTTAVITNSKEYKVSYNSNLRYSAVVTLGDLPGEITYGGQVTGVAESLGGGAEDAENIVTSEALVAGDLVHIYDNAGTPTCRKACAAAGAAGFATMGYVKAAFASGASAKVFFEGSNTGVTGLVTGTNFLSVTPGLSSNVAPSVTGQIVQQVGYAIGATKLNFDAGTPVVLA